MGLLTRIVESFRNPGPDRAPFHELRVPLEQRQIGYHRYPSYQYNKPVWPRYNLVNYLNAYEQVVVVYACVNLIADAAASAKVRVYDEAKDDAELPNHPLRQLLRTPNSYMSESEFYNAMVKTAAITGFAVAEKERSAAGRVVGLHPLRSDWLKPIPRENNMTDWEYIVPGNPPSQLKGEDAIAWTYQGNPSFAPTGMSPLCAALREVSIETALTNFIKAFFDSGGIPQTAILLDSETELDQAEADTLKAKVKQNNNLEWEMIVLQTVKDIKRLGFDLNEMAYKDLRHLTSSQICSAFRIHPLLVDLLVGLENAPWSEFKTARRSFYEDTVTHLWARLDGALTRSLLPDFETSPTITLEFDTSEIPALQEDDSAEWDKATKPGIEKMLTINDRRAIVGLPAIEGGDVRLLSLADIEVPVTVIQNGSRSNSHVIDYDDDDLPIEFLGGRTLTHAQMAEQMRKVKAIVGENGHAKIQELPLATDRKAVGQGLPIRPASSRSANDLQSHCPGSTSGSTLLTNGHASLNSGMMRRLPAETRAKVATTNKQHIVKIGERGAVWLRKFWRDQGERIVGELLGVRIDGEVVIPHVANVPLRDEKRAVDAIDWAEEERLLAQQLGQIHHLAGKTAFGAASDTLGVDVAWDVANPNVQRVLERLGRNVAGINDTTRTQLQDLIGEQLNQGVSLQQLADAIKEQFDGYGDARAMTTARSESQVAYNTASALGYKESGVASNAELIDNPGHGGYGGDDDGYTCAERDGMIVPVENVSIHAEGTHPNCILAIVPVLDTALGEE